MSHAREGQAVVIVAGRHVNEPAVILNIHRDRVALLLSRTGQVVTVRQSSISLY